MANPNPAWWVAYQPLAKAQNGTDLIGPCPSCGGDDRFFIKKSGRFGCRGCEPSRKNVESARELRKELNKLAGIEEVHGNTPGQKGGWVLLREHTYVGRDMQAVAKHQKWRAPDDKTPFSWRHWDGKRWQKKLKPYRLDQLVYNRFPENSGVKTVFVLEGEKDVDTCLSVLPADETIAYVCGGGGASNPYLDWPALKGVENIWIFFDADSAGRKGVQLYGAKAKECLPDVKVMVYAAPGKDGTDLTDVVEKEPTLEDKRVAAIRWLDTHKEYAKPPEVSHEAIETDNLDVWVFLENKKPPPQMLVHSLFVSKQVEDGIQFKFDIRREQWFSLKPNGVWEPGIARLWKAVSVFLEELVEPVRSKGAEFWVPVSSAIGSSNYLTSVILLLERVHSPLLTDGWEWDNNPEFLGTPHGVYSLRTVMKLSDEEASKAMVTRETEISPKFVSDEEWKESRTNLFLNELCDFDSEKFVLLLTYLAYMLTGYVNEQKFVFMQGVTGNGKSVFMDLISFILRDYATTVPTDEFAIRPTNQHPTSWTQFDGVRGVLLDEQKAQRWDTAKLKKLSGGEGLVKGRKMHKDFYEFKLACKIFITANQSPRFDFDDAMKRRVIYLRANFIPDKVDLQLSSKLKAEAQMFLGELMKYSAWWIEEKLDKEELMTIPDSVDRELRVLMQVADDSRSFIEEMCVLTGKDVDRIKYNDLRGKYKEWLKENGLYADETDRTLTLRLTNAITSVLGGSTARSGSIRYYTGIKYSGDGNDVFGGMF